MGIDQDELKRFIEAIETYRRRFLAKGTKSRSSQEAGEGTTNPRIRGPLKDIAIGERLATAKHLVPHQAPTLNFFSMHGPDV